MAEFAYGCRTTPFRDRQDGKAFNTTSFFDGATKFPTLKGLEKYLSIYGSFGILSVFVHLPDLPDPNR